MCRFGWKFEAWVILGCLLFYTLVQTPDKHDERKREGAVDADRGRVHDEIRARQADVLEGGDDLEEVQVKDLEGIQLPDTVCRTR